MRWRRWGGQAATLVACALVLSGFVFALGAWTEAAHPSWLVGAVRPAACAGWLADPGWWPWARWVLRGAWMVLGLAGVAHLWEGRTPSWPKRAGRG